MGLYRAPQYETASPDGRRDMIERLMRIGGYVPAGVELGYHLCYGDSSTHTSGNQRTSGLWER